MVRMACLLTVLVSLFVAPMVTAQSGSSSTLEQQINPVGCNSTTIATGMGITHDSTCPIFAPTIESIASNQGRPIIRGIYDAAHSSMFRVRIASLWYVLGTHAELTANGNVWELDLSSLKTPLDEGTYAIIAEMRATDGSLLQTGDAVVVRTVEPSQGETPVPDEGGDIDDKPDSEEQTPVETPTEGEHQPRLVDETSEHSFLIPVIIVLLGSGAILLGIVVRRRFYGSGGS